MRNKLIIAGVAVLAVIVCVLGYLYLQTSREANRQNEQATVQSTENQTSVSTEADPTTPAATPSAPVPGTYVDYSEKEFKEASGERILFFHAPWCPQCRMLDASISKAELPDDTTIFKVDYDSNQDLRKKYGVTLQTTIVKVDADGNLVDKYVAYNEPSFEAVKENLLD